MYAEYLSRCWKVGINVNIPSEAMFLADTDRYMSVIVREEKEIAARKRDYYGQYTKEESPQCGCGRKVRTSGDTCGPCLRTRGGSITAGMNKC